MLFSVFQLDSIICGYKMCSDNKIAKKFVTRILKLGKAKINSFHANVRCTESLGLQVNRVMSRLHMSMISERAVGFEALGWKQTFDHSVIKENKKSFVYVKAAYCCRYKDHNNKQIML